MFARLAIPLPTLSARECRVLEWNNRRHDDHRRGTGLFCHAIFLHRPENHPFATAPERKEVQATATKPRLWFYDGQYAFHDLVDVQAGGVDEDGVFGRPQWRHRALGITGVTGENLA